MEKILEILKNSITGLNEIGTRLYSKYGTESYVWRCTIHDIRTDLIRAEEQLKIHESKELSSLMSADLRKELREFAEWLDEHYDHIIDTLVLEEYLKSRPDSKPIEPINKERVILDNLLAKIIKRRTDVDEVIDYFDVADFELAWIQKYIEESIASELCDAGQREEREGTDLYNIKDNITETYLGEVGKKDPVNNDKAIIEKQDELIKIWENLSVMSGPSKYLKMLEKIERFEQELQALKGE